LNSDFSVYPNPTNGILNIQSDNSIKQIYLVDLQGKRIALDFIQNSVDLSTYTNGFYILHVQFENGTTEIKRIIKK
jgi:hypothetical protein